MLFEFNELVKGNVVSQDMVGLSDFLYTCRKKKRNEKERKR